MAGNVVIWLWCPVTGWVKQIMPFFKYLLIVFIRHHLQGHPYSFPLSIVSTLICTWLSWMHVWLVTIVNLKCWMCNIIVWFLCQGNTLDSDKVRFLLFFLSVSSSFCFLLGILVVKFELLLDCFSNVMSSCWFGDVWISKRPKFFVQFMLDLGCFITWGLNLGWPLL